jgi:pimeloyl-ACP methyl ester carboxylesterase
MSGRRVDSQGVGLAVHERGDPEAPVVVLVHGYPDTHRVWDEVAELLEQRYRVIAYDVRGAGGSDAPDGTAGYRMERLAEDLGAVLDATSPDRPAHLVGHDWGAVASWEAVQDPRLEGRIASFTAVSGPCLDHLGDSLRRPPRGGRGAVARAEQAARSWYVLLFQLPWLPELLWRGSARGFGAMLRRREGVAPRDGHPAQTLERDAVNGIALYRANVPRRLLRPRPRPISVPVQVVAPAHDRFLSEDVYAETERRLPGLRLRRIDAGHWVQRTHPDKLAGVVGELVDEVETS